MARRKKEPMPGEIIQTGVWCNTCEQEVVPIGGKTLIAGNTANWRHKVPGTGCKAGDPLMDDQVH